MMNPEKAENFWKIQDTDTPSIVRSSDGDFSDFIEMSGLYSSFIVTYGEEKGQLVLNRHVVFPMLRTSPNNTHASFQTDISPSLIPVIYADGIEIIPKPQRYILDGTVRIISVFETYDMETVLFPCTDKAAVCEYIRIRNNGKRPISLSASFEGSKRAARSYGCRAVNLIDISCFIPSHNVKPGEWGEVWLYYTGRSADAEIIKINVPDELSRRQKRVLSLTSGMKLTTDDLILDTMFSFAELRAGESIFRTQNGDVHSPGGGAYYAAVWCNDQVEYSGPWFAYTNDTLLQNAAYNAYSWFFPFMDSETYDKIPSSIIAEGFDRWDGAGDRGDAAMYLYGASRYMLTRGGVEDGGKLWKAIRWCAEYCKRKIGDDGVILSDTDELEGRLPTGCANLSTNMLAYGGFLYASRIAQELGDSTTSDNYNSIAVQLRYDCEKYFAASTHGFDTYKYYKENTTLRSWICLPLCMDIFDRADGTSDAIMSDYLMCDAGQLSEEGTEVAWDRSTLYGLRGVFRAGKTEKAYEYLKKYCASRLLSAHVPYPVEAWPEGGRRQLSGESALFCQIVTEGMLGFDPMGFHSFSICPHIPEEIKHFSLCGINAFGEVFDIRIENGAWQLNTAGGRHFSGITGTRTRISFEK